MTFPIWYTESHKDMSGLTREEVLKLAALSRLKLTEEEIDQAQSELSVILNYVQQLDSVDTANLEPTYQVTRLKNVMRRDRVMTYQAKPADLLKNAPATKDGQFKVNRII